MAKTVQQENSRIKLYTESLGYQVKLTEKYVKMHSLQLFSQLDSPVSPEEFLVLDIASTNPDICQRDLAKLLVKDRANTGRLLESLEKKKLIERVVDVKNNRLVKKIVLTSEGENVLNTWMNRIIPVFEQVYAQFTEEEIEQAKQVLSRMREAFKEIVNVQI